MKRMLGLLIFLLLLLPACRFVQIAPIAATETAMAAGKAADVTPAVGDETAAPPSKATSASSDTNSATPAVTATFAPISNPGAQEIANYDIAVGLDPQAHKLIGKQRITYLNNTHTPITELVFHLYLNAFKNKNTVFMRESGGQLRGFSFNPERAGWIEVRDLALEDGTPLKLELLEDGTLARARLPQAIPAGAVLELTMKFESQLPEIFARTGWALDDNGDPFFLVGQWFPKLGVWTDDGWAADVFHGNAEFFADFGRYQVAITLPDTYTHGATGVQVSEVDHPDNTRTVIYQAAGVIDFVWTASPNLKSANTQVGDIEVVYLYLPEHDWSVEPTLEIARNSLELFSGWFGDYPYPRLTISDVPEAGSGAGGMEYPTFITVGAENPGSDPGWSNYLEIVTVHEVAHQWWQSMVATNEAREPWLDEGFADYSTIRYFVDQYGLDLQGPDNDRLPAFLAGRRSSFLRNPDLPVFGTAWEMAYNDYVIAAYSKPDMILMTLEGQVGENVMLEILQTYFEQFRFKHPTTGDFRQVAEKVYGQSLDWFFDGLVYGDDTLNWVVEEIQDDTVLIERQGTLALPADVLVVLANGQREMALCPAQEQTCRLTFPGQSIQTVMVDPDRKLMVETNWSDNQLP